MDKDNKPLDTDPEEPVDSSAEGDEDVSTDEDSDKETQETYYKELTGRDDIKTKEDFDKHYEGLKNLVGDQAIAEIRKKAKKLDEIDKEADKEADKILETKDGKKIKEEVKEDAKTDEIAELTERLDTSDFVKKNPDVEPYIGIVKAIAERESITYQEAYDNHAKELIAAKLESDESKNEEQNSSIESKTRLSSSKVKKLADLVTDYEKSPGDETAGKLIEEYFSE